MSHTKRKNQILSVGLLFIILVLGFFLYQSIVTPYEEAVRDASMRDTQESVVRGYDVETIYYDGHEYMVVSKHDALRGGFGVGVVHKENCRYD